MPKQQEGYQLDFHLGYYPVVHKDKLILFYNDDEDNITHDISKDPEHYMTGRRSVFVAAIIDAKGNLTRQPVYSHRKESQLAVPTRMSRISDTKYALMFARVTLFISRTRFGILEIK